MKKLASAFVAAVIVAEVAFLFLWHQRLTSELAEAKKRLAENPDKYVQHVFGETEVGGTGVIPSKLWSCRTCRAKARAPGWMAQSHRRGSRRMEREDRGREMRCQAGRSRRRRDDDAHRRLRHRPERRRWFCQRHRVLLLRLDRGNPDDFKLAGHGRSATPLRP